MHKQRQDYDREGHSPDEAIIVAANAAVENAEERSPGWRGLSPLAPTAPELPSAPPAGTTSPQTSWNRKPLANPVEAPDSRALDAALAEASELRAMLALARETSQRQRVELGELRERLAIGTSEPALQQVRAQLDGARKELREHREARQELESLLRERDEQIRHQGDALNSMQERLQEQDRALLTAREEHGVEHARHARTLQTLTQLRETLDSATTALNEPLPRPSSVEPMSSTPSALAPQIVPEEASTGVPQRIQASRPQMPLQPEPQSGPTRAHWLDDRVRARFGPLGADRLADLVRGARRTGRPVRTGDARFLLLGRAAADAGPRLAESLLAAGETAFTLHCVDHVQTRDGSSSLWSSEAPIHALVEHAQPIESADDLDAILREIQPDAIVCQDFLSYETEVGPWLDRLGEESRDGCTLVFIERTGIDLPETPQATREIAERIWSRMPERHRRMPDGHSATWSEIFTSTLQRPANGLYEALRERMQPDLTDRFGYLALAFVDSPISRHFDPSAERDRRFLTQLADLDEHRIESGEVPALSFVARVDPNVD